MNYESAGRNGPKHASSQGLLAWVYLKNLG